MKKTITLIAAASLLLSGCLVVPFRTTGQGRSNLSSGGQPKCAPSQYWDGAICRHKGQGSGARKHDG
jgi:hypothetical protein